MQKTNYILFILILIIAGLLVVNLINQDGKQADLSTVNLQHQVEMDFAPDLLTIVLGVETLAQDPEKALTANSQRMEQIMAALQEMEGLSYQTSNFQINPQYLGEGEEKELNYRVLNQLEIETTELEEAGRIIEAAISAGANQVLSLSYHLKDSEEAQKKVLEEAIQGFKEKAEFLKKELGKKEYIINSLNINDYYLTRNYTNVLEKSEVLSAEAVLPPISPEKINIRVQINGSIKVF